MESYLQQAACPSTGVAGRRRSSRRIEGFTLIELMMVLVLIAILLGIGGPSFQESLRRNRMQSTLNEMAGALALARGEAVVRTQPVALCPTTDTVTCSGGAWETGYLVFADDGEGSGGAAADGARNGNEELLRIGEPAPAGITVRTIGFNGTNSIVFENDGRVQQNNRGTMTICDARGATEARGLVVEVSGQTRLAADTTGDNVPEDHLVTALACP